MSFLKKLFGKKEEVSKAALRFGHFTDCNKSNFQLSQWDVSNSCFKSRLMNTSDKLDDILHNQYGCITPNIEETV